MGSLNLGFVRLPALSDGAVVRLLSEIADGHEDGSFNAGMPGASLGTYQSEEAFLAANDRDWSKSRMLSEAWALLREPNGCWVKATFRRFSDRLSTQWETEIEVTRSGQPPGAPSEDLIFHVWEVIEETRARLSRPTKSSAEPDGPLKQVLATEIAQLADLHIDIVERAEVARRTRDEELEARRKSLEDQYQAKQSDLDRVLSEERARIQEEGDRLEEMRRQLDDRAHMHARRELRGEITKTLAARLQRPGVSRNALLLRLGVSATIIAGAVVAGWIAATSSLEVSDLIAAEAAAVGNGFAPPDRIALYAVLGRLALSSAVCLALIFYLIGWLRRVLEQDERSERELERYRYDIDRATWAIETILEVKGKDGTEIPNEWVRGVTHGLFQTQASKDEDTSALEALGALLNISAKAEISPGGTKLEINKRGLKQLGKQADELGGG